MEFREQQPQSEEEEDITEEDLLAADDAGAKALDSEITKSFKAKRLEPGVYARQQTFITYPKKLNLGLDVPATKIYLPKKKKKDLNLPDGVIKEQEYVTMSPTITINKKDYEKLLSIVKKQNKTMRAFFREALVQYVQDIETFNRIRDEEIALMAKTEVRSEVEAVLMKRIEMRKLLWEPRYGKKGEYMKKGPEEINKEIADELGLTEELEDYEKEDKDKMVERLRKKDLWKPKYTKKPPEFKGRLKTPDEELERELDKTNDNYALDIKTEGVLPQEKGIIEEVPPEDTPPDALPQDAGIEDAPSEEEMKA